MIDKKNPMMAAMEKKANPEMPEPSGESYDSKLHDEIESYVDAICATPKGEERDISIEDAISYLSSLKSKEEAAPEEKEPVAVPPFES